MKIVRLYAGNDQKSHFEEIELKFGGNQLMLNTEPRNATSAIFRCVPAALFLERHPAPRRQFLVSLSDSWEIEASNGAKRVFKTGDVMLADDTSGEGHTSRVSGSEPHIFMTLKSGAHASSQPWRLERLERFEPFEQLYARRGSRSSIRRSCRRLI